MATVVVMPALDMGQESGMLVKWLKSEGDSVTAGDPLMEIETEKVVVEIEAPASGVLAGVRAAEGEEIPVGQIIAHILAPGEELPALTPDARAPGARSVSPTRPAPPAPGVRGAVAPNAGGRPLASPRARRLAAEQGVSLAGLQGSGPGGAVTAADLAPPIRGSDELPPRGPALSRAWTVMADRMVQSWTSAPHFVLTREVEVAALTAARDRLTTAKVRPTYTDLLIALTAASLRRHPNVNARWANGQIELVVDVNVGIATATDEALIVPVLQRADTLKVSEIAARRQELVDRAASGALRPEDVAGGSFTLSNLGMYGVDSFVAIINPPQAAILAVGAIKDRVIAVDGQPAVRPTLILNLSCDHRVVDGARAARFFEDLVSHIQDPSSALP